MTPDSAPDGDTGKPVGSRWIEVVVALLLMALGAIVVTDSVRVGIGWGDDGPRSGYFPFYIGLLLCGASTWILLSQLLRRKAATVFAGRGQIASVMAMLVPTVIYVALIAFVGIYVASALLIGYFMVRYGKYHPALTLAVALGVPIAFYLIFERWFLVLLPKGPLERWLGL